ncbi:NAD(+) diphosphatase [Actinophytocola xanthii]|uniref:NAD(+) diphosphatase n=1 Tax=Actinophytocola xanthii TaxID=1912961 RepID=A0A1Q8CYK2_9PSEU|nr:NAD(+) diphosphatase [Actinophytocola xanthii]OLF19442.1 hypothetical protein BU204_00505 [Actinophytocola xanthii]
MSLLPYNGLALDRASARRSDEAWLSSARRHPDARVLAFWRDGCLTRDGQPVTVSEEPHVFLGANGRAGVFAVDLSELDESTARTRTGADAVLDVRRLFPVVDAQEAATLAYARGMLHWHRNQRFCGACGGASVARQAGHQLECASCGRLLFPRIEPAVITLVTSPDGARCLLGRHRGAAPDAYSTLAGFVEIGESLEDAVRRELVEEVGVRVAAVRYQASQAWPFPAGLMLGFRAVAESEEVAVDQEELVAAHWFTREDLRALQATHRAAGTDRQDSIESHLLQTWLDEG